MKFTIKDIIKERCINGLVKYIAVAEDGVEVEMTYREVPKVGQLRKDFMDKHKKAINTTQINIGDVI